MAKDYDLFKGIFLLIKRRVRSLCAMAKRLGGSIASAFYSIGPALRFKRSLYRQVNGPDTYAQLKKRRGALGEYLVYDRLRKEEGRWLFNVYLPHDGESTEIDALLISSKGLFIFESKNFSGRIYGADEQKNWYRTIYSGLHGGIRKDRFFNPLMQNGAHCSALKALVPEGIPIYPIVVFGRQSELYLKIAESRKDEICRLSSLKKQMRRYRSGALRGEDAERIYRLLLPFTGVSDNEKNRHIRYVRMRNR